MDLGGSIHDVTAEGTTAYVAGYDEQDVGRIWTIDVADASQPAVLATIEVD